MGLKGVGYLVLWKVFLIGSLRGWSHFEVITFRDNLEPMWKSSQYGRLLEGSVLFEILLQASCCRWSDFFSCQKKLENYIPSKAEFFVWKVTWEKDSMDQVWSVVGPWLLDISMQTHVPPVTLWSFMGKLLAFGVPFFLFFIFLGFPGFFLFDRRLVAWMAWWLLG